MAGVQDHRLAAAVSNAGALGSLPAALLDTGGLERELRAFYTLSGGPLNVNFFCHVLPSPTQHVRRRGEPRPRPTTGSSASPPSHQPGPFGDRSGRTWRTCSKPRGRRS
ncbi:nitronate monooxygenase [Deinococcus apachensis]|uniref:nitronate monooxygenase n=1 Tax=Deinococcus apachensis TaxID=309886 RepID=UPI001B7FDFA7